MADTIQATPRSNKLLGLLSDMLGGAYDYTQRPDPTMPMGLANPVLGLLGNALPLKAGANVLDDLSYGRAPVRGTGMTTRLTPDATELAINALPFPRASGKATLAAMGAMDTGGLGKAAIVWQGSPHKYDAEKLVRLVNGDLAYVGGKFNKLKVPPPGAEVVEDFPLGRIRSEAIGIGEGNQAYGHGSYLAENPATSGEYIRAGRDVGFSNWDPAPVLADKAFAQAKGDKEKAISILQELASGTKGRAMKSNAEFAQLVLQQNGQNASLYKVDLPDNMIARMLDWDKPLSQQAVNDLLTKIDWKARSGSTRGIDLYGRMTDVLGSQAAATAELQKAGIPGIRYLDGGSRGAGAGTSNFVVFPGEESALRILSRNGLLD